MKKITTNLEDKQLDYAENAAVMTGRSVGEIIRVLITEGIKNRVAEFLPIIRNTEKKVVKSGLKK